MDQQDFSLYKEAFRSISIPALIFDTDLIIRDVNTAGLDFTGYAQNEFVGENVSIVAGNDDTHSEIVETIVNDEAWSGGFPLETKTGQIVYGRGSVAPIILDEEKRGYVAIFIDTTKRRQYRNTSEVLNRLLRHDLRNDVNVLYGSLQRALVELDEDYEAVETEIDDALNKLSDIVRKTERARDLSAMLEESFDADNHAVRLDHVLNETLVNALQEFDDTELYFNDPPEVKVVADDLLRTVLKTLIENAVMHNDKDPPTVTVDVEVTDADVVISVVDNGPGVPDREKDLIFGREEEGPLHHGSGISLFFADNVINSYEGKLWVEDNDPEGAVFKLQLDRAQ